MQPLGEVQQVVAIGPQRGQGEAADMLGIEKLAGPLELDTCAIQ
jgi:hypothetical protein